MDICLVYLEEFQFLVSNFLYQTLKWQMSLCCVDPFQLLRNKQLKQKLLLFCILCLLYLFAFCCDEKGWAVGSKIF